MSNDKIIKQPSAVLSSNVDTWINQRTGECIEAVEVTKKLGRQGFMITYLSAIINLIDSFGTKKMVVVKYLLENMDKSSNSLFVTSRELALKCSVSLHTVTETLKALENANIIKRRTGGIMINSDLVHRGSHNKEKALIARFQEFGNIE